MAAKDRSQKLAPLFRTQSVVDSVVEWIVNQIIDGTLKPGDKLPTELEMCHALGVGRNSIREAIKKLQAYGVVYIKRAEGTFIAEKYSQKMLDPLLYGLILQNDDWKSFIDLRRAIDIGTLYVVTRQERSLEDMAKLHRALAHLEEMTSDPGTSFQSIQEADTQFHHCLAELTHNPQLITMSTYIGRLTIPSRLKTTRFILEQGLCREYIQLHQQIVRIVETEDVAKIEDTVNMHYTFWERDKV